MINEDIMYAIPNEGMTLTSVFSFKHPITGETMKHTGHPTKFENNLANRYHLTMTIEELSDQQLLKQKFKEAQGIEIVGPILMLIEGAKK